MKTNNGVPYVAVPPSTGADGAPLVVIWHLLDAPRTEVAMASALPLRDVPAWKVYLGLPMSGQRTPQGGPDEFMRLVAEDSVRNVFEPITTQAVAEFPRYWPSCGRRFRCRSSSAWWAARSGRWWR